MSGGEFGMLIFVLGAIAFALFNIVSILGDIRASLQETGKRGQS